jgi:flavin reductase (DIM6/NTAB) family NADH-FMN oxidoreductase RutF
MSDLKTQAEAVGHIPSGLFIVTTFDGETKEGYLASWVQQVSFSPLLISLAVNPDRRGYQHLISGKAFSINIVGDHEMGYLKHFWSGYAPENNPFNQIEHEVTANNTVAFKNAKSTIECVFVSKSKPGDHEIVIAEVINSIHHHPESKSKIHLRKSGLDY